MNCGSGQVTTVIIYYYLGEDDVLWLLPEFCGSKTTDKIRSDRFVLESNFPHGQKAITDKAAFSSRITFRKDNKTVVC